MPYERRGTYDLGEVKRLLREGRYFITEAALDGGAQLGFGSVEITHCVLGMTPHDLYKTMPALKRPGLWQDVYRPVYQGVPLYVKVQLSEDRLTVVIQFKKR